MSDGWIGLDGYTTTAVTPRASLKSDANNMLTTYESGQGGVGPSENCINGCLPEITNHKPAHSQSFLNNFW